MPIHDQSYRRYGGERRPPGAAWAVIASFGLRSLLANRRFLGLLILAWLPFVVRTVQIYVASNYPQAAMLRLTAETFREFLEQQEIFVFFVAIFAGAGLIAHDKRAGALQIYLSKPLSRVEYVVGKLAILAVLLLAVTWLPATLLLLVEMLLTGKLDFIRSNPHVIPAIAVFSAIQVLLASFTMVALSALSKSSRFVGIMYAGVTLFSDAIFEVLRGIFRTSRFSWISVPALLEQLGDAIFRLPLRYETPWMVSLVVILALIAGSILVLERRVRGVEVVT